MDALAATGGCDTGAAIGEGLVGLVGEEERSSGRRKVSGERSVYTRRGVATYPVGASRSSRPGSFRKYFRGVQHHCISTYYGSGRVRSGSPGLVAN